MNEATIFVYENEIGRITFAFDSPFWITEIDGISKVDVSISTSMGASQIGATISSQNPQPRVLTVSGCLYEPVKANRAQLLNVIAPKVPAKLTMIDGAESWYLDVVPESTPEVAPGDVFEEFQFRLYAAYPYWRTSAEKDAQIAGLTALFKFPFYTGGSWYISEFSENYYSTLTNTGNVPIEAEIVFAARASLKNPEIYHTGTGKKIKIVKEMSAGERIAVSTVYGEKGVKVYYPDGTEENGFKYLSFESDLSFSLVPGDNLLRVDALTNREALSVRVLAPQGVRSGV